MDEQRKQVEMPSSNVADYSNEINAMYDAQRAQQEQSLKSAYDQNVQTLQNSKAAIAPMYNQQANDLATQYERTRRNNNMQADVNGLNTGYGSQMALAQQSNYLNSFGKIRSAQAQAEQAVNQKLADLEVNYKNSVAQALAENDYQKAAAMLQEYKRRDEATKEEQRYQYQIRTAAQQYADQLARQQAQDAFAREQYNNSWTRQQQQDAFAREQYDNSWARQQEQDAFAREQYNNSWSRQQAQDALALQQYQDAYARQQAQDAFAREQYDNSWARQQQQDALAQSQYGDQQALNAAKTKAAYGDFSGYAQLYGQETADAMKQYWTYSNPEYAYTLGLISADEYAKMTGKSAATVAGGGYSGYGRGGGGTTTDNTEGPGKLPELDKDGKEGNASNKKLTPEQQLGIAGGVMSGNISSNEQLQNAYYAYHMIESDAKNEVRKSGVDPNSEEGKKLVETYVAIRYADPYVSLEDIQSAQKNRTTREQAEAEKHKNSQDNSTWEQYAAIGLNNMGV